MEYQFVAFDAKLTDGSDLTLMDALYRLTDGRMVRIPANTLADEIAAAIAAAMEE